MTLDPSVGTGGLEASGPGEVGRLQDDACSALSTSSAYHMYYLQKIPSTALGWRLHREEAKRARQEAQPIREPTPPASS